MDGGGRTLRVTHLSPSSIVGEEGHGQQVIRGPGHLRRTGPRGKPGRDHNRPQRVHLVRATTPSPLTPHPVTMNNELHLIIQMKYCFRA